MPYILDDKGIQVPTLAEILEEMFEVYRDPDEGFGPEADVSQDSPFYILASPVARQMASAWQGLRDFTGQYDPEGAGGQQLDRLGSLVGIKRRKKTRSIIERGRIIGTPNTVVVAGATVRYKPLGTLWQLPGGTIPASGVLIVVATAIEFGPVDARQAGPVDWEIVSGGVNGWDAFDSLGDAQLGAFAQTGPEYRAEFFNAARGLATYDAVVKAIRAVNNVTAVLAYVNPKLAPDPSTGLLGKQWRIIVTGGAKDDIIAAMHASLGAPVDTVGAVEGSVEPGNGQVLTYRFDRLKRRRGYLRLTYTGGNPLAKLPDDAEQIVVEAVAGVPSTQGAAFNPMVYGAAGLVALLAAKPGCVTKVVAEGRLSPGDPYQEDAITIGLDEIVEVATEPVPAEAISVAEDPMVAIGLSSMLLEINGNPAVSVEMPIAAVVGSEAIADACQDDLVGLGVVVDADSGRVRFRTELVGSTASLGFISGSLAIMLGLELQLFEGSDGDVEVVLIP